jgi:thiol-disulfide isomerase/thioredoxin
MKLIKYLSITTLVLVISCSPSDKFDSQFYKTTNSWNSYLSKIGVKDVSESKVVFLFMRTSECAPCLKELRWWNKNADSLSPQIKLVLVERYKQRFKAFISSRNITLDAYQDSSTAALKNKLIPTTPVKFF